MQKPLVFNRYLNKKWKEEENSLLANKLGLVRSQVDLRCPNSYTIYQTKLKRDKPMSNIRKFFSLKKVKEFEVKKDNEILAHKITTIFNSKSPNRSNQALTYKRSNDKTKLNSEKEKWKIFKIAQENQSMLKRLHDVQTVYNNKKYCEDFEKSRYYKKNICEFVSNTNNTSNNSFLLKNPDSHFSTHYGTNGFFNHKFKEEEKNSEDFTDNKKKKTETSGFKINPIQNKKTEKYKNIKQDAIKPNENQILLFYKTFYFQDLMVFLCNYGCIYSIFCTIM